MKYLFFGTLYLLLVYFLLFLFLFTIYKICLSLIFNSIHKEIYIMFAFHHAPCKFKYIKI